MVFKLHEQVGLNGWDSLKLLQRIFQCFTKVKEFVAATQEQEQHLNHKIRTNK